MVTAQQANTLHAKIKAEMLRRNGHGSLTSYGGSGYNFTKAPTVGELVEVEHGDKTIDLLLKIEDFGDLILSEKHSQIPTDFTTALSTEIDRLAKEAKTGLTTEVSSCRGDCTGLCVGSCHGKCNGCTSCTASCGTGCASGCNTTCTGGCQGNCTGTCYKGCSKGCNATCTGATKTVGK